MSTTRNTEQPLSARSVVASTLLGIRPPRLPTRILVSSGALFGIAEGTTRVALSRMVAAGELEPDGDGYRLAGAMVTRQQRQDLSRRANTRKWRGNWRTEIVTGDARPAADRAELRSAANSLRLAELREGVWLRPDNLPSSRGSEAEDIIAAQCSGFTSRPSADSAQLAAELWDLNGWAATATALQQRIADLLGPLEASQLTCLPDAFVLSASVLRHFQSDPLLPTELLPADWPGAALRGVYDRYDRAFADLWTRWYRAQD